MSDRNEKYRQRLTESVSPHVDGPPLGVGMFMRAGGYGAAAAMQVSGLAGMLANKAGKKKSGGLPQNVIVAATDDHVHVFDYRPKGTKVKIKEEVARWERSALRVERSKEGVMSSRVLFHLPDGTDIELDAPKSLGTSADFNAPLIDLLLG